MIGISAVPLNILAPTITISGEYCWGKHLKIHLELLKSWIFNTYLYDSSELFNRSLNQMQ
jgi:hypothetical protein